MRTLGGEAILDSSTNRGTPRRKHMKRTSVTISMMVGLFFVHAVTALGQTTAAPPPPPPPAAAPPAGKPAMGEAQTVKVRGTISAVDKENHTVTLKGPRGRTLTLEVHDPAKLEVLKVGDPVVGTYYEAILIEVKKAGTATPGATMQEGRVGSKPGETPAGAMARQITITGTIVAIHPKVPSVAIKGPQGGVQSVKVKDVTALADVKVGDLVELTYTQALAVALDKPAPK
jgi:Cu/Ag efflux protein CusF